MVINRLLKNAHLRRSPHPSSLRRTYKYASRLRISGALHLSIFEQPDKDHFFSKLLSLYFRKALGARENRHTDYVNIGHAAQALALQVA